MTKVTAYTLLGWIVAGGLIGAGAALSPLPPVPVALVAAGLAVLLITCRIYGGAFTALAAIVTLSPAILPQLPAWAALFIATVVYLIITDLVVRFG